MTLKDYATHLNRLVALGHGNRPVCRSGRNGMQEVVNPPVVEQGRFQRFDPIDLRPIQPDGEGKYISLDG